MSTSGVLRFVINIIVRRLGSYRSVVCLGGNTGQEQRRQTKQQRLAWLAIALVDWW